MTFSGQSTYDNSAQAFDYLINCGVFVAALFLTFKYHLLDLKSWPKAKDDSAFEPWFNFARIPSNQRENYYNDALHLRGRHVISSLYSIQPVNYQVAENTSWEVLKNFQDKQICA
ncbi:hypothetical protein GCM10011506_36310 [Marivirga lumbricoides]|uniref:Uncharacterized protein n=1 Tax=Marivirga lumbricoides TaxID=1046115 RepID=A0ABQ1MVB4_9BACT|nr:hypothetical protein GCM10011506_36310 [Marivirga lumbricoides]